MSDNTQHPMLKLLELTSLNAFLTHLNFQSFTKLEAALIKDGKSVFEKDGTDVTFYKPINTTDDLFQNEVPFLHGMIEGWARAVMQPLVDELNENSCGDDEITLYFDGDLLSAALYFEDIESYVSGADDEDVADIKNVLADWEHSAALIANIDELTDALEAKASK